MKKSALALATLAVAFPAYSMVTAYTAIPPSGTRGNVVDIDYEFGTEKPATGMSSFKTQFHFFKLADSPSGTRFVATSFSLESASGSGDWDVMYIGINPANAAINYPGQVHFSYFGNHAGRSLSPNCSSGADGGGGMTCALGIKARQGFSYRFEARILSTDATTTVVQGNVEVFDGRDGSLVGTHEIGRFEVLRGDRTLAWPVSWVEGDANPCTELANTTIVFTPIWRNGVWNEENSAYVKSINQAKCGATASPGNSNGMYVFVTYPYSP